MGQSVNQRAILTRGSGVFLALFEAVGLVSGFQDVAIAVVGDAVHERRGHLGVTEDLHPLLEGEAGDQPGLQRVG